MESRSRSADGSETWLTRFFAAAMARRSKEAIRRASASTKPSSSASGSARLTYPYRSAVSPSKSFAPRMISSARPRPTRCGRRSVPPPPGCTPTPTSGWPSRVFSRDAKRMSQARTNSLLTPRTQPRIFAMLTTGDLVRRTNVSIRIGRPEAPTEGVMLTRIAIDCRVWFAGKCLLDLSLRRLGNELVLLGQVHQQRRIKTVDLAQIFLSVTAVISDRGVDAVARSRQEGHQATETK